MFVEVNLLARNDFLAGGSHVVLQLGAASQKRDADGETRQR